MAGTIEPSGSGRDSPADGLRPFLVDIPLTELDDLQRRLVQTRWSDELPVAGWDYGVPVNYIKKVAARCQFGYDWRRWDMTLNQYPQFATTIDGQQIHFLHVRSPHSEALPLSL